MAWCPTVAALAATAAAAHRCGGGRAARARHDRHQLWRGALVPALGANGAESQSPELKLGRVERKQGDAVTEVMRSNAIMTVQPGQRVASINPGGGGWGQPLEREIERVVHDVRNGYVSIEAAASEYGVAVDSSSWTGTPCGARLSKA